MTKTTETEIAQRDLKQTLEKLGVPFPRFPIFPPELDTACREWLEAYLATYEAYRANDDESEDDPVYRRFSKACTSLAATLDEVLPKPKRKPRGR